MKRGLLIIGIVLVLLLSILSVSVIAQDKDFYSCKVDSDCVLVDNLDCRNKACECVDSVNINKQSEYNNNDFGLCPKLLCEPCPPTESAQSKCINNRCETAYPSSYTNYSSGHLVVEPPYSNTYSDSTLAYGMLLMMLTMVFGLMFLVGVIVVIIVLIYFFVNKNTKVRKGKRK